MTVSLPLFIGLGLVCTLTWAGWAWAEVRNHRQAAALRRVRSDLASARHENEALTGWYLTTADQVVDAERRLCRLQRAVDGAGVLVVPAHTLAGNGAAVKMWRN